jgi:hypothetical protein
MLHLLQSAVDPGLSMAECVRNWPTIARQLREAKRRRRYQVDVLTGKGGLLS